MKRLLTVGVLFLLTLGVCIVSLIVVQKKGENFEMKLENIKQSAENGEEKAAELITSFNEEWHKTEPILSRFMRGDRLEELTAIFARLGPLLEYGDRAEFFAEINRGKILLEHIWITERPHLKNIF